MSIQIQRKQSLTKGRFSTLTTVHCAFLELCYIQRYTYCNTQGRLSREKPLQSVGRWLKSPTEVLRSWRIKNRRMFI